MRLHSIKRLALTLSLLAAFVPAHASMISVTFNAIDVDNGGVDGKGKLVYGYHAASQSADVTDFSLVLSDGLNGDFKFGLGDISNFIIDVDANGNLTKFSASGSIPSAGFPGFNNNLFVSGDFGGNLFYLPEGYLGFTYAFDTPVVTPDADVPEPVSIGLFGIGLAGLLNARRRKV